MYKRGFLVVQHRWGWVSPHKHQSSSGLALKTRITVSEREQFSPWIKYSAKTEYSHVPVFLLPHPLLYSWLFASPMESDVPSLPSPVPISACLGGNTLDHPCRTKGEKVLYNILFSVHGRCLFPFKTYVKGMRAVRKKTWIFNPATCLPFT